MGLFKKTTTIAPIPVTETPAKPTAIAGWTENDLVSVYNAGLVRKLHQSEAVFLEAESTESVYVVMNGSIQVAAKWAGQTGQTESFGGGDCVAPIPKSAGVSYCSEAIEASTVVEITPAALNSLPDRLQLSLYKMALRSTGQNNAAIRSVNIESRSKCVQLASYILKLHDERGASMKSDFVQKFLHEMPKLPAYATTLAGKLLDDRLSVKEVVEGINQDPAIVGIVLRNVNSAQFSFPKKIESFYNACMILGFNNIYNLIMREAMQSAMPVTAETKRMHKHSVLISVLCYEIAAATKSVQCQTATTFGLLHDVGKGVQSLMKIAHPDRSDYIDALLPSQLTAELLSIWGLPDRICKTIELQHHPEFMPPDMADAGYRSECATLYLAHVLQSLMTGEEIDPVLSIYAGDYLAFLGLPYVTPTDLLKQRVMPILLKNRRRLPDLIQDFVDNAVRTVQAQQ